MRKSAEEVRIQLGLKPFDEFEYEALLRLRETSKFLTKQTAIQERFRQTGRTTRVLCEALATMSEQKYVIVAGEHFMMTKHLTKRLMKYAEDLGLDTTLILTTVNLSRVNMDALRGLDLTKVRVFWDHNMP